MTGQDIQDRLDAIVEDLQTKGKGQTVQVMFRDGDNHPAVLPLSSDVNGVVDAAQLNDIQLFINDLKTFADDYEQRRAPVLVANEAYNTAREPHQALIDAASLARKNLSDALTADAQYQAAKTALETARQNADYITASNFYKTMHVSENYAELQSAKGNYYVF